MLMSATKVDGKNYKEPCLQCVVFTQPKRVYKGPVLDILISCILLSLEYLL